tara:strand:+ start:6430 stop:6798 length:369 start_codon:yes stop_codon:yes gene_type:complete
MILENKQQGSGMLIKELFLNKGVDVEAEEVIDGVVYDRYLGCGLSIAKTIGLIKQYADGDFIIEYQVHQDFIKQDTKKFEKRIATLVNSCEGLEVVKKAHNKVINGHIFYFNYITVVNYKRS